jgi:hypothetical protein
MKKNWLTCYLGLAVMLAFTLPALAQRPAGAGSGRPAGTGPGSVGTPSSVGPSSSGRSGDVGSSGMGHSAIGSQSPTTVLDNSKLNTSLVNALAKSNISVPGGDLKTACSKFKTLGQCIAAMHAAKNLNLSFSDLESRITGSNSDSLGKAIQDLGGANIKGKSEAKKADKQASQDFKAAQPVS